MFNRNKKSIGIDIKSAPVAAVARKLALSADIVVENFKPGALKKFGLRLCQPGAGQRPADLRQSQGLPARAVRAPHGARRSGADDGRPGLHDRPPRRPVARRHERQRHHGRDVRRDRRARRADPARHHRQGHGGAVGPVREQRLPHGPAHAAVRRDRQAPATDAGARQPLGGLRRVHRQGRRADLSSQRSAMRSGDPSATRSASPTSRPIRR